MRLPLPQSLPLPLPLPLPRPARSERREAEDERVVHRACTLCEACCGLAVTVRGSEVLEVRGDPDDPFSQGYLCPKGVANADLVADPDRLRQPLLRAAPGEVADSGTDPGAPDAGAAGWRSVGWAEALDATADGLARVLREHGPESVAIYLGNPAAHGGGALLMAHELLGLLGARRRYSASSLDQQPQHLVSYLLFGNPMVFGVPDLDRTDHLLILGGNPAVSNGSIMTAPDMKRRLRAIRERGGRVVVVDPRRTETARVADEHIFIRPGTDVFLLLGMLHTLVAEELVDVGAVADLVDGVEELCQAALDYPPDRVAEVTGVPAERIAQLARDFAGADSAAGYGRLGVCQTEFGTTTFWLLTCLNILTGNLDRPGGLMFPRPALDAAAIVHRLTDQVGYDRFRSRIGDLPEVSTDLPVATLAAEIRTPGPGQIRALVTIAGNPALSVPDGRAMDEALAGLEVLVSIDPYITETSRHADVVLPPRVAFERDELEVVFGSMSVRNMARYSPRAVEPAADTMEDAEILAELIQRLATRIGSPQRRARALAAAQVVLRGQMDRLMDLAIRTGPYGNYGLGLNLGRIRAATHGLDLGPLMPSLPGRLFTRDRRIPLAHPVLMGDLSRVRDRLENGDVDGPGGLLLIGRRHLRSNNSWMANSPRLVRGKDRCTVLINPADARARGIVPGARVLLSGPSGSIEVPAEVSDEIMEGVVAVPHGWGHDRDGVGWRVAADHPGASVNDVTDSRAVDPLSGNAALQAVPVSVEALVGAAG